MKNEPKSHFFKYNRNQPKWIVSVFYSFIVRDIILKFKTKVTQSELNSKLSWTFQGATISMLCLCMLVSIITASPSLYYREKEQMGCPAKFDSSVTIHLPHPTTCEKYLTCLSKSVIEQLCPPKMHWNVNENMCDYIENANCQLNK